MSHLVSKSETGIAAISFSCRSNSPTQPGWVTPNWSPPRLRRRIAVTRQAKGGPARGVRRPLRAVWHVGPAYHTRQVNAELNRQVGLWCITEATGEELETRLEQAERWLARA